VSEAFLAVKAERFEAAIAQHLEDLGVFLAFAGQFIISEWSGGPLIQALISLAGILIMVATASLISWYKYIEGRSPTSRVKPPDADLAGGEA